MTVATLYTAHHGLWMTRASATSVTAASTSAPPTQGGSSTTSAPVIPSSCRTPPAPTPETTAPTTGRPSSQPFRDGVQFCSGLVDLVVCVRHPGGGGHRLALAGER